MTKIPIAYFVFNRPEITKQSFAVLKKQKPFELFIIADGPRLEHTNDQKKCSEVRKIVEHIDWPCKVYRNYAKTNLGLKQRIESGLNWVFERVEKAIILEDDCIAHPDFFNFCSILLDRYYNNKKVSAITGNNFQKGKWRGNASYYFSINAHCWGWATWRRAWKQYQGDIPFWPEWSKKKSWLDLFPDKIERYYWQNIFDQVYEGKIDSWAYPWTASIWYNGGLTVTPNSNLVSNIGFGLDATHTTNFNIEFSRTPVKNLGHIKHPKIIERNLDADKWTFYYHFGGKYLSFPFNIIAFFQRLLRFMYRILKNFFKRYL